MILKHISIMNAAINHLTGTFYKYIDKYHLNKALVKIIIYRNTHCDIPDAVRSADSEASAYIGYMTDDGVTINRISAEVYVSAEDILMALIDFDMDFDKCMEFYDLILLHEIGHIVHATNTRVGRTISEVESILKANCEAKSSIKPLRKNSSVSTKCKWIEAFLSLPNEADANSCVGIKTEDIIKYEKLRHATGRGR